MDICRLLSCTEATVKIEMAKFTAHRRILQERWTSINSNTRVVIKGVLQSPSNKPNSLLSTVINDYLAHVRYVHTCICLVTSTILIIIEEFNWNSTQFSSLMKRLFQLYNLKCICLMWAGIQFHSPLRNNKLLIEFRVCMHCKCNSLYVITALEVMF